MLPEIYKQAFDLRGSYRPRVTSAVEFVRDSGTLRCYGLRVNSQIESMGVPHGDDERNRGSWYTCGDGGCAAH